MERAGLKRSSVFLATFFVLFGTACTAAVGNKSMNSSDNNSVTYVDQENTDRMLSIYYGTAENAEMMERLCDDYEAWTGIEVLWEAADNGTNELKKRFAVDEAPDLFSIAVQDLEIWSDHIVDLSTQPWVEDLPDNTREMVSVDGRVMAWPHTLEANGIVYNKRLFAQAGITEIPVTLNELQIVCERLEAAGIQSFGESWMQFGYLAHILAAPFEYTGAEKSSKAVKNGEKTFGNLEYMDNYFDFLDLTLEYGKGAYSVEYNTFYQYADFAAGNMAMMKQGTWCERILKEMEPDLEIGLFALPLSNRREENRLLTSVTTFLCINQDSKNREEALQFIQWWHEHAKEYLTEINGTALPFKVSNNQMLGNLHQDLQEYIESGNVYTGFGYEYWPADFHEDSAQVIQLYIQGLISREETKERLTRLYLAEAR